MRIFGVEMVGADSMAVMRETIADLSRQLDDIGWINLNQRGQTTQEQAKESYRDMVRRSRLAYIKNPLVAQAVHLTTYYTFGEGVQTPNCDDESVQKIISDFWSKPDNRIALTSSNAQIQLSNKIQYDGEIVFAIQVDRSSGECYVRVLDPLTIEVVYDKRDSMRPSFYKRPDPARTGASEYFPDVSNGAFVVRDEGRMLESMAACGIPADSNVKTDVFILHAKVNNDILDVRGVPEVWRALDWINSNAKIAGDMASFINAQSQYALKKTVKGTKAQVQAQAARIRQNPDTLANPSRQAGSTLVQNDLIDTSPIGLPSSTGAVFETGIRRTLLMVCAAFGIMEHYFGDPSTGNLATTTMMELPMLKKFLARQKFWEEIILSIVWFRVDMDSIIRGGFDFDDVNNRVSVDRGDAVIDIDFPPIIVDDLEKRANALSKAKSSALMPVETCQRLFMASAGINNVDEELKKEFQEPEPFSPFGAAPFGGQADDAKESVRKEGSSWFVYSKRGKRLGGPYVSKAQADKRLAQIETFKHQKEASLPSPTPAKRPAAKLADKNREVLSGMSAYLKEIGEAYKKLNSRALEGAQVSDAAGKYRVKVRKSAELLEAFASEMNASAAKWFPKAAKMGFDYARAHVGVSSVKESLREATDRDFVEAQYEWNRYYVQASLVPALRKKIREVEDLDFEDEAQAVKAVSKSMTSMQSRVAMYAAAFWTVEERAVKEAARGSGAQANFVGVDDASNCEGCQAAIDGNPWPADSVPSPGEQDCLGMCRHAIQFVTDEPLSESDTELLRESEMAYKAGIRIIDND